MPNLIFGRFAPNVNEMGPTVKVFLKIAVICIFYLKLVNQEVAQQTWGWWLTWLKSGVHCLKSALNVWSPERRSWGGLQTPGADFKQWTPDFQQIGRGVISILRGFLKCTRQRRVLLQIAEEDWNTLRPIWYQIILRHSREIIWRLVKHYPRNLFEHEEVLLTCC